MYIVIRTYSGPGAKELFDLLEERKAEIEPLIRSVSGFVSYSLARTDDGGVTVTICEDQEGTDESIQVARDWVRENASHLEVSPPQISQGFVLLQL